MSRRKVSPRIDALLMPQIEAFHGVFIDDSDLPGTLWNIDPAYGRGYYWNYIINDMMTVNLCELEFFDEVAFSNDVPDFFCMGKYNRNMSSYFYRNNKPQATEQILGYAWRRHVFSETVRRNTPLRTVSISLLPEAMQVLSTRFLCAPQTLATAISELDGTQIVPGLSELFDTLFILRPQKVAALCYYESKIAEACALLIDWHIRKQSTPDEIIRAADRTAINRVLEHIHENLESPITLDELCKIACMSASKLAKLFKITKYKSPMEYVRGARMDHARALLSLDDISIHEVSMRLGFTHQGSFSEAFKAHHGITPRAFRRTHLVDQWPTHKA